MNLSTYLQEQILFDYVTNTTVYLGLFGQLDGETVSQEEVWQRLDNNILTDEIDSYDNNRQVIDFTTIVTETTGGDFAGYTVALTENVNEITYTTMPSCSIYAVAIMDQALGGNVKFWVPINEPVVISAGGNFPVNAGKIILKTK